MRLCGRLLIFTLIILLTQNVTASTNLSSKALFDEGVKEFNQGDYNKSISFFSAAKKSGLDSDSLHYNLGVCYYKTKKFSLAKIEFKKLLKSKKTVAIALYNLGLIELNENNKMVAKKYFKEVFHSSDNLKLKKLASIQLNKLSVGSDVKNVSGFLSFAAGYNDNVSLTIQDIEQSGLISDTFLEITAGGSIQLTGSQMNGLQLNAVGYNLNYNSINQYDLSNLRLNPAFDKKIGAWQTEIGGSFDMIYIDNDYFENIIGFSIKGSRSLTKKTRWFLQYQFNHIGADGLYNYLSGQQQRVLTEVRAQLLDITGGVGYRLELNSRKNNTYPTRQELFFTLSRKLFKEWDGKIYGKFRRSQYHSSSRKDDRLNTGLRFSRQLPYNLKAYGKYEYTQNHSTEKANEYDANVTTIGLEYYF